MGTAIQLPKPAARGSGTKRVAAVFPTSQWSPPGTGGHSVLSSICHPSSCPQGLVRWQSLGSARGISRHACPSAIVKRQEGQSWGFPAPSQLSKCSALLMKRPLFLSLRPCTLIYRPFDNQLQTRSARPSHQRTKACALWAECSTSLLGGFL